MPKAMHKQGYTIVETMIFLAVSGLMFIVAAGFISGKQTNAEFRQGVTDVNTQVQQVINNVGNGYYNSNENISCTINPITGGPSIATASPAPKRGTNKQCVFLGNILQFRAKNPGGTNDPTYYKTYTVAGLQYITGSTSESPTSYSASKLTVSNLDDVNQTKQLQWGLNVVKMSTPSASNIGSVGFLSGFANGTEGNGSQSVTAVPIQLGLGVDVGTFTAAQLIQLDADAATNMPITICFRGSNGKYATITIGENGQRLATSVKIGTNDPASLPGKCS